MSPIALNGRAFDVTTAAETCPLNLVTANNGDLYGGCVVGFLLERDRGVVGHAVSPLVTQADLATVRPGHPS